MGNGTGNVGNMANLNKNLAKIDTAAADAKKKAAAKKKADFENIDTSTVSGRVKKAAGINPDQMQADIAKGAEFGEAVIGPEGLGRIGEDPTQQAMAAQAAELAKGFTSEEQLARKEKGLESITSGTQAQSRAAQAALARSGVKGQAAGAQLGQIALGGVAARGNLERDLIIANREAQVQGLQAQSGIHQQTLESQKFDISQAAKEKDIALQAGLGFAQLGSTERSAAAASQAQVKAAKAGKSSCFIEGTKIKMANGKLKNIEDITLADFVEKGGVVYSVSKALISEIYNYNGIIVAGGHAVLEEDKWIRVEDSKQAIQCEGIFPVYNMSNENHRIVVEDGTVFADYDETDQCSNINDKESLEVLNGKGSKVLETGRGL